MEGFYLYIAGLLLLAAGLFLCFMGLRLVRVALGVVGFILGLLWGIQLGSVVFEGSALGIFAVGLVGGVVGAALMAGVALLGLAALGAWLGGVVGALVARLFPFLSPEFWIVLFAVLGAVGVVMVRRGMVALATAGVGAWLAVVGGLALAGRPSLLRMPLLGIFTDQVVVSGLAFVVWLALAVTGAAVQLGALGVSRHRP